MPKQGKRVTRVPLEQREPASIRACILARSSDPNAPDERLDSQVEACEQFVKGMGWTLLSTHTEKKSGDLHLERPALELVEELLPTRVIEVVVCLHFERH